MPKRLLQSALCIFLSPLLVAQQVPQSADPQVSGQSTPRNDTLPLTPSGFVAVTKYTEVDLVALDAISSVTATVGSKIRFRVARDVIVQNTTVVPAGTLLIATITKVITASKKHHRDGKVKVRFEDLKLASGQSLRLKGGSPEELLARKENRKTTLKFFLLLPLIAPMLPYIALMAIGMWNEGGRPDGKDAVFEPCFRVAAYTTSTVNFRLTDLAARDREPSKEDWSGCPNSRYNSPYQTYGFQIE